MNVWSIKYPISIIRKLKTKFFRSSRSEVFCKDGVLKIFVKFIEKHLRSILFLTKLQVRCLQLYYKEISGQVFSCGFAKFLRTLFLRSTFGDCFGKFFHGLAKFFLVRSHSLSKKKKEIFDTPFLWICNRIFWFIPSLSPYTCIHKTIYCEKIKKIIIPLSFIFILKERDWLDWTWPIQHLLTMYCIYIKNTSTIMFIIFWSFLSLSRFSLHHKWNEAWFLVINTVHTSCRTN